MGSQFTPALSVKQTKVFWVDGGYTKGGSDGSLNRPFKTLTAAISAGGNMSAEYIVTSGTYPESVTITAQNISIKSIGIERGAIAYFQGTLTFAHTGSSIRMSGITADNIAHSNAGSLYLDYCRSNTALTKSGGGYLQAVNCDTQSSGAGTISVTGSGSAVFQGGTVGALTVNNSAAVVSVYQQLAASPMTLTSGTLILGQGTIYSASSTSNALSAAGGTVLMDGVNFATPTGTQARISIGASAIYQSRRAYFDVANSVISGTNAGSPAGLDGLSPSIKDTVSSASSVYSSQKVDSLIAQLKALTDEIAGEANTFAELPAASANSGLIYTVKSSTGVWGINRKSAGLYRSDGTNWSVLSDFDAIASQLQSKEGAITAGTTAQYWRGDKTFADFFADVRAATLSGLSTASSLAVSATDSVLVAIGKLQAQANRLISPDMLSSGHPTWNSSGDFIVGSSTIPDGTNIGMAWRSGGDKSLIIGGNAASPDQQIGFVNANGLVGTVVTSGSSTSYNTSSDYRLKDDPKPIENALAKVLKLRPKAYVWKSNGLKSSGFLAHELQEDAGDYAPESVFGEKDAVDEDGNPIYQSIDARFLIPMLTASIQELSSKCDQLSSQVEELKG